MLLYENDILRFLNIPQEIDVLTFTSEEEFKDAMSFISSCAKRDHFYTIIKETLMQNKLVFSYIMYSSTTIKGCSGIELNSKLKSFYFESLIGLNLTLIPNSNLLKPIKLAIIRPMWEDGIIRSKS